MGEIGKERKRELERGWDNVREAEKGKKGRERDLAVKK